MPVEQRFDGDRKLSLWYLTLPGHDASIKQPKPWNNPWFCGSFEAIPQADHFGCCACVTKLSDHHNPEACHVHLKA